MNQLKPELSGNLLHNLLLFARLLRALGLAVNPGRVVDVLQALEFIEIGQKQDFFYTVRSLLVHNREDLPTFDKAFKLFWRKHPTNSVGSGLSALLGQQAPDEIIFTPPPLQDLGLEPIPKKDETSQKWQQIIEITRTYSRREILRHKDFGTLTEEEMKAVRLFMNEMVWELGWRRTRRQRPGQGTQVDLRRSLRCNMRYGGELLQWSHRQFKFKPRPLVIIADTSGSMEQYTRLLLHFIYGMARGLTQQVEAFVFSTRLTRISRELRQRNLERALHEVSNTVTDWASGTRIGDSLKAFNFRWGRRVLSRGAIVLLISDGWDRGSPHLLQEEIGRLQRSCYRLIWLNPLLGSPRYEPLTRGMQASLPFVDDFLPVHNLASLQDLATHLAHLTVRDRTSHAPAINLTGSAFISRKR